MKNNLETYLERFNLPQCVRKETIKAYKTALYYNPELVSVQKDLPVGCIYFGFKKCKLPFKLDELSEISGLSKREIGINYRRLIRNCPIRVPVNCPLDFIDPIASDLELSDKTRTKAVEIVEKVIENDLSKGRNPIGIAATALYVASLIEEEDKNRRRFADVSGITEMTMKLRCKDLLKIPELNLKDVIP